MSDSRYRIGATWVVPVTSPPIPDGFIEIVGETIREVGPRNSRTLDIDLGNAVILPGLVNAHTHLDLSDSTLLNASGGPIAWLEAVIGSRRNRSPETILQAIELGIKESRAAGVTSLGDIVAENFLFSEEYKTIHRRAYIEVLGLSAARQEQMLKRFEDHRSSEATIGFSPHAPYSTSKRLFELASTLGLPVCSHVGEFQEEEELLRNHNGPFAEFLKKYVIWHPEELSPSWAWILETLPERSLIAHANYLPADWLIRRQHSVVYCPRTHAHFGHSPHPFRKFLFMGGINVCLGTDSRASNPDLDPFAEAIYLHRSYPDFSSAELIRMLTINGARALGFDSFTGSIEVGKFADLVALPIDGNGDPVRKIFESEAALTVPRWSMFRGIIR